MASSNSGTTPAVPAEDPTIRSLFDLARPLALVLALVAGVLFLLSAVLFVVRTAFGVFSSPFGAVYWLITAIVNYLIWKELPALQSLAAQRQYSALKERMLLWAILGVIFFLIEGVLLLLVYLKIETVSSGSVPVAPPFGAGGSSTTGPAPPPGVTGVASPPVVPFCSQCGAPTTYVDPGRYYCAHCARYV